MKLSKVTVAYSGSDRPAIEDVDLELPLGSLSLITGPNGAGKTTLLECCLGLLKPIKGEVFLLGVNTKAREIIEVRKKCSYVPQDFIKPPYETYTVGQVLHLGLAPYVPPFRSPILNLKAMKVVEELELSDLVDKPIGTLSGGQQQRVLIARALIREPLALFLDEPLSCLDRYWRDKVMELVNDYVRDRGALALVVSHDPNPVENYVDYLVEMSEGKVKRVVEC